MIKRWDSFTEHSRILHEIPDNPCYHMPDHKEEPEMAQPNSNSEWYDQSESVQSESPAASPRPKKNRRSGILVLSAVVGVLTLIVLSVYAFSDRLGPESTRGELPRPGIALPENPSEDYRDFFDEYFAPRTAQEPHGSSIPRVRGREGVVLSLNGSEEREEMSLREVYEHSIPSIVSVRAWLGDDSGSYFWGTGIILTPDGYILTNQHIVDRMNNARIRFSDGTEKEALLVGEDYATDLAVLKVEADGLKPALLGDSGALAVGQAVAAIGNPISQELLGTMTDGIISGAERTMTLDGRRMRMVQTNAAINEGNSGGPLLNLYGQVVGIINMKLVNRTSEVIYEGMGFAIPSSVVREVANALIAEGAVTGRPALGVTLGAVPVSAQERFGVPAGLYVYSVSAGSDCREKGIVPGDVVVSANGEPVASNDDLMDRRDGLAVGDTMTLTVWRDGATFEVEIVLRDQNEFVN